jgi:peptidoglycan-N-acetylglucosamine deacetylase
MNDSIILTFDLEEWFHLCLADDTTDKWSSHEKRFKENIDFLLELLNSKNIKATFLVLGWIAKEYPEVIKEISTQGHDIGSHSYFHELIYNQSYDQFKEDLNKSLAILEDITEKQIEIYRAPAFSINDQTKWALELLLERGIRYDLSLFQGNHSLGGISGIKINEPFFIETPSGTLLEYPISITDILNVSFATCGGGYFRLLPYEIIRQLLKRKSYRMTYFHPRDFDYLQPRIKMSPIKYFKTYIGLKNSKEKLIKLVNDFRAISLSQDLKQRDMTDLTTIDINQLGSQKIINE